MSVLTVENLTTKYRHEAIFKRAEFNYQRQRNSLFARCQRLWQKDYAIKSDCRFATDFARQVLLHHQDLTDCW